MRRMVRFRKGLSAGVVLILAGPAALADTHTALILENAKVYTVDEAQPWAEAIAIDARGVIVAVGRKAAVRAAVAGDARRIDLKGRMVLPGFQDVHLHALEAGINARMCGFGPDESLADYKWLLRRCARRSPGKGWVIGAGVNMTALLARSTNPLAILDDVVRDRPVLILDDLGHGAWVNTRALQIVGYDRLKGDPPGGVIVRDGKSGRPNGVVLENAQQKLRDAAFAPTKANRALALESLRQAQRTLSANGITSVSDAGGYWPQGHPEVWREAEHLGLLRVRASNALYVYPDRPFEDQIKDLKSRFSNDPKALVRFNHVKIYVDGILSQATAALYAPYETGLELGKSERRGLLYFEPEILNRYASALAAHGFQLHFHATGDRGAGIALDAIEAASGSRAGPHRITHLYLVDRRDRHRFHKLGVVADFQLAPSSIDAANRRFMTTFIGKRADELMAIRSLVDAGAAITLSSDWDADELSPLRKLQTVLTRPGPHAVPDLATALEMMTINPARALGQADRTGSITPGKFADLVILERDLFELPVSRIGRVKVDATLLQGKPVYDRSGLLR